MATESTRFGNHRLKNAFYLAAFVEPEASTVADLLRPKAKQGKRHTQALLCLARRRVDVLHAMLTTNTLTGRRLPSRTWNQRPESGWRSFLVGGRGPMRLPKKIVRGATLRLGVRALWALPQGARPLLVRVLEGLPRRHQQAVHRQTATRGSSGRLPKPT